MKKITDTDKLTIRLICEKNEQGLELLKATYEKYCFTIIKRIVINDEDAEECQNDVWLKAWQSIPRNEPKNLKAYLAKISRNTALNMLEKNLAQKRGSEHIELSFNEIEECIFSKNKIEENIEYEHLIKIIVMYLKTQKTKKRIVFVQRYFYLMSVEEISNTLKINKKTVSTILFRMRKELKEMLEREEIM